MVKRSVVWEEGELLDHWSCDINWETEEMESNGGVENLIEYKGKFYLIVSDPMQETIGKPNSDINEIDLKELKKEGGSLWDTINEYIESANDSKKLTWEQEALVEAIYETFRGNYHTHDFEVDEPYRRLYENTAENYKKKKLKGIFTEELAKKGIRNNMVNPLVLKLKKMAIAGKLDKPLVPAVVDVLKQKPSVITKEQITEAKEIAVDKVYEDMIELIEWEIKEMKSGKKDGTSQKEEESDKNPHGKEEKEILLSKIPIVEKKDGKYFITKKLDGKSSCFKGLIHEQLCIGDKIKLTQEALENYGKKYNKTYTIELIANSVDDHRGYDESVYPMLIVDCKELDFALYENEFDIVKSVKSSKSDSNFPESLLKELSNNEKEAMISDLEDTIAFLKGDIQMYSDKVQSIIETIAEYHININKFHELFGDNDTEILYFLAKADSFKNSSSVIGIYDNITKEYSVSDIANLEENLEGLFKSMTNLASICEERFISSFVAETDEITFIYVSNKEKAEAKDSIGKILERLYIVAENVDNLEIDLNMLDKAISDLFKQ